jgi:hypothetical protein
MEYLAALALGFGLCYLFCYLPQRSDYKTLWIKYVDLNATLVDMKKQGFVRQFDIQQRREHDPAADIREY